jgi:hypothetical protein
MTEHNLLRTSNYGAGTFSVFSFVYVFSTGTGPAHLLVDLEHNLLLTSNYGAGTLSCTMVHIFSTCNGPAHLQSTADQQLGDWLTLLYIFSALGLSQLTC